MAIADHPTFPAAPPKKKYIALMPVGLFLVEFEQGVEPLTKKNLASYCY